MLKRISFAKVLFFNGKVPARNIETSGLDVLRREVGKFDAKVAIEAAATPPSVWFNDSLFHELDKVQQLDLVNTKL